MAFDVGNSETTIGLYDGDSLRAHWRVTTAADRTPDELALLIRELLSLRGHEQTSVRGSVIASVVPALTRPLADACAACFDRPAVVVDASSPLPIRLAVDEPLTVGADRVVNTLAASRLYGRDTIVVDLGTATTFDCVTSDGIFLGGVIAPGVRTLADTLIRRTAKLPATELTPPLKVIGTRTEDCIRAGVVFGAADAVDGIVRRIKRAWPRPDTPFVVATGGLAETVQNILRVLRPCVASTDARRSPDRLPNHSR